MQRKLIIRNRRNYKEMEEITLDEFKRRFHQELALALRHYIRLKKDKEMLMPPFMHKNTDYEEDFYAPPNLLWNFNNFAQCEWFIDRFTV